MKIRLLILQFFLSTYVFAQTSNTNTLTVLEYIYDFQFDKAANYCQKQPTENSFSNNLLWAQLLRWKHLPLHSANDSITDLYEEKLLKVKLLQMKSTFDSLSRTNSHLMLAEHYYNKGQNYKAFQEAYQAYQFLSEKLERNSAEVDSLWLLPLSLYHYYYDYYKSTYSMSFTLMWALNKGDKQKGLDGLTKLANTNSYGTTEALIYLSHIYLRFENEPKRSLQHAIKLHQKYPNNLKFYELLIENNLANQVNYDQNLALSQKLIDTKQTYFVKYGLTYQALTQSQIEGEKQIKADLLENALASLKKLGGGNHLESLLYTELIKLKTSKQNQYLTSLEKVKKYDFVLTQP